LPFRGRIQAMKKQSLLERRKEVDLFDAFQG
jgi:hypothetical protein